MKIFITGFQRSGTTLLRRIIHFHPDVRAILHERNILKRGFNNIKFNIDKENWGEKLPWFSSKRKILEYCKEWNKRFKNDAKIIQIVRHPKDVMNSNLKKFRKPYRTTFNIMNSSFPKIIIGIDELSNCLSIKYENLVMDPDNTFLKMFDFIGLDSSPNIIKDLRYSKTNYRLNGIQPSRAFAYKKENNDFSGFDFSKINEILNKIEGSLYEN